MRFHNYNKERRKKGNLDLFLKAVIVGVFAALGLIMSGIGIKFLVLLMIQYWIYVVAGIGAILLLKKLLLNKRRKNERKEL